MDDSERPGRRIAKQRKVMGLSQRELAARAGVSYSLLTKVESGHASGSSSCIGAIARALGVDVAYVLGAPYLDTEEGKAALHHCIPPIRRALASYNLLDLDDDARPRPLAELAADIEQLGLWRRDTAYDKVGAALPGLIAELQRAVLEASDAGEQHRAAGMLAMTYRGANTLAHKLGYVDLSLTAMERMERAAEDSGDPLLVATADYLRAAALARIGDGKAALRLLHQQINNLDPWVTREGEEDLAMVAVLGALQMRAGVIAASMADADRAVEHLDEAARLAEWSGPDRVFYETTFGPVNVQLHRLAAEVDLAHPGHAIQAAADVHLPDGMARERKAYYWIDRARAHLLAGDLDGVEQALYEARAVSLLHFKDNRAVQQVIYAAGAQQRRASGGLRALAHAAGIAD
jgi:transcriptional regulator with XRE-family HTH domain